MRRLWMMCSAMAAASCGPMNPSVKMLDLALGHYMLVVNPSGACTGSAFVPGVGTLVILTHEGEMGLRLPAACQVDPARQCQ